VPVGKNTLNSPLAEWLEQQLWKSLKQHARTEALPDY